MKVNLTSQIFILLCIPALLLTIGCGNGTDPDDSLPEEVTGTVVDFKGYPLPGATISAGDKTTTSNSSGQFTLETVVRGEIEITKQGYKKETVSVPSDGDVGDVSLTGDWNADTVEAPFDGETFYAPSGWMGDYTDIAIDLNNTTNVRTGDPDGKNIKFTYTPAGTNNWAGVIWQYPENNFGAEAGRTIVGATKAILWVRGEVGGEILDIKAGNSYGTGPNFFDSFEVAQKDVALTTEWQKIELDLADQDTKMVLSGFIWTANGDNVSGTSISFYLDELRYE